MEPFTPFYRNWKAFLFWDDYFDLQIMVPLQKSENQRAWKAYVQDRGFNSFVDNMIKSQL